MNNTREAMSGMTPAKAYAKGFGLSAALKHDKRRTKVLLLAELTRLVRHVNATRTFANQSDLQDAVDDICELFPTLKVEEILTAFKHIRQGKFQLYGNFTTNVLLDCLRQYDLQNTVTMREQEHDARKVQTATWDVSRLKNDLMREGLLSMPRKVLDRTFIYYPNDTTDETPRALEYQTPTAEKARPETDEARIEGET